MTQLYNSQDYNQRSYVDDHTLAQVWFPTLNTTTESQRAMGVRGKTGWEENQQEWELHERI